MKKCALFLLLLIFALLLAGCGSKEAAPAPQTQETPLPTAPPVHTPSVSAQGKLADAARALLAPYQNEIALAAERSPGLLTYLIPGDLLSQMAQDAQETGAEPEEGRYVFTWHQSARHTYTASAMQIQQIEEAAENTPDPRASREPVMDNQQMGDFTATGGGTFDRSRAYNVSESLREGAAEFTDTLNGQTTGHELFSFSVENDAFYFVDAILDQAVGLDGLMETNQYLVAMGVMQPNKMEIMEFSVPSREQIPSASAADWALQKAGNPAPLSYLKAEGSDVQVIP